MFHGFLEISKEEFTLFATLYKHEQTQPIWISPRRSQEQSASTVKAAKVALSSSFSSGCLLWAAMRTCKTQSYAYPVRSLSSCSPSTLNYNIAVIFNLLCIQKSYGKANLSFKVKLISGDLLSHTDRQTKVQ